MNDKPKGTRKATLFVVAIYGTFFILSFGASAHGADIMWSPFLLLALLGSLVQLLEETRVMRFFGFILVLIALACAALNVLSMGHRLRNDADRMARSSFLEGQCAGQLINSQQQENGTDPNKSIHGTREELARP